MVCKSFNIGAEKSKCNMLLVSIDYNNISILFKLKVHFTRFNTSTFMVHGSTSLTTISACFVYHNLCNNSHSSWAWCNILGSHQLRKLHPLLLQQTQGCIYIYICLPQSLQVLFLNLTTFWLISNYSFFISISIFNNKQATS